MLKIALIFFTLALQAKPLKVCTSGAWAPFSTSCEDGFVSGTHYKRAKQVFDKQDLDVEFVAMPWKRCLEEAKQGNCAFVYSASKKPDREEYLYYPETPLETVSYVVVTRAKDKALGWTGEPKTIPQTTGVPLGFSVGAELTKAGVDVDDGADDDEQNLNKLLHHRVDSVVMSKTHFEALKENETFKGKLRMLTPAYTKGKAYYITVSKAHSGSKDLLTKLEKGLKSLG